MTHTVKDIERLVREITQNSNGNFPLIVLDTGGLIDIASAIREYNFHTKNGDKNSKYEKTSTFLTHLSERVPVLITKKTYQEIQDHGRMIINSHTTELSTKLVDFALDKMTDSIAFISGLRTGSEMDRVRYDAYWASKEGCNGNTKKCAEGCSDTDKEILSTAAYLSQCRTSEDKRKKIGQVIVISPDAHIIKGTEFLKRSFDGRYSNIVPVSTRN